MEAEDSSVRPKTARLKSVKGPLEVSGHRVYSEASFCHCVNLERKRSDRSSRPFLLVLVELDQVRQHFASSDGFLVEGVFSALSRCLRETDLLGWYTADSQIGCLFTETGGEDEAVVRRRVHESLADSLPLELVRLLSVKVFQYPERKKGSDVPEPELVFFPQSGNGDLRLRVSLGMKRALDVSLSLILIVALAPLFLLIAVVQKCTSEGPVLWRQERVGLRGRRFTLLKFRSMYVDADPAAHQAYVARLIEAGQGKNGEEEGLKQGGLYKLRGDKRITPVGRVLRQSSMDELPQLFNVLRGEMSLVGPRPPIAYELGSYQDWHLRRVMEVKPGMTGLWQVSGRSRTSFDDMVRLDLRYSREWSLGLDLSLLARTPMAVLKGDGAC